MVEALAGAISNSGTLSMANCTLSGNSAIGGHGSQFGSGSGSGGAITDQGTGSLINCTLSGNSADMGSGIEVFPGSNAAVTAVACIFNNSPGGNVQVASGGSFISLGHNLFSDTPAVSLDPTDLINTDPRLGPLAANGGPTATLALLAGSPAIDAGVSIPNLTTDQRGVPRPEGSAPDIGAFEYGLPPTVVAVHRNGVHFNLPTIVVSFSLPMDAASAQNLSNYVLVSTGLTQRRGTPKTVRIRIRSARYDAGSQTVTLRPTRLLALSRVYRLTIIGTAPDGLTSVSRVYLDGAGTGLPGNNAVVIINRKSWSSR